MKTVIVTGATRGLGLEICRTLLAEGYFVIGIGRSKTEETKQLLRESPDHFCFEPFDLSLTRELKTFSQKLLKTYGRPWALINNAASGMDGVLATQHESDIAGIIKLNIESPILLSKYMVRPMLINQGGRIVNISSIIADNGYSGLSVYAATKSALNGFTRSLAREVGRAGITVNSVAPGYMKTEMTAGLSDDKLEKIVRRSALKELPEPEDVASMVAYLISEQASRITGTVLTIDAGNSA